MRRDPRKRYSTTSTFAFAEGEPVLFRGLMPRDVTARPAFVEHEVRVGDRLDKLADDYYGDARMWWVIAQANRDLLFAADLVYGPVSASEDLATFLAGRRIVIPAKPEGPT